MKSARRESVASDPSAWWLHSTRPGLDAVGHAAFQGQAKVSFSNRPLGALKEDLKMKTNNTNSQRGAAELAPGQDRLVSKREAALICGGISVRTLEREVSSGRLTKVKFRGRVLFRRGDVMRLAKLEVTV